MTASRKAQHLLLATTALAICVPQGAFGQGANEPDPNVSVVNRVRPEYQALGIRAGAFLISPELALTETYSDNVEFDDEDEKDDLRTTIAPSVEMRSDWSVHELGAVVGSEIAIHADNSDQDFEDFFAEGDGRLDITRQTSLNGEAEIRRGHEGAEAVEDNDDEVTDTFETGGALALEHRINRLNFIAGMEADRITFDDEDEEDRDQIAYDFTFRTGYDISERLNVFGEGRYNIIDADENVDDNGNERDSDGYEARAGVALDVTSLLFGEAFVGYRVQQFDEEDFDKETGLSFGIDLNWNPTLLTSVGLSGTRDFQATDEADAASNFRTAVGVTVDHELFRNLLVGAEATYVNDDFTDGGREDDTIVLGTGLTYWLNRNISVNGGYEHSTRDSSEADEDFTANEISIGLTLRL